MLWGYNKLVSSLINKKIRDNRDYYDTDHDVEVKIIPKDMIEIMGVMVPKKKVKLFLKMIDV